VSRMESTPCLPGKPVAHKAPHARIHKFNANQRCFGELDVTDVQQLLEDLLVERLR